MVTMKRAFLLCLVLGALLVCGAPAAMADTVELGATSSSLVAPTCPKGVSPANCTIILTRTTALETLRDGVTYPTTAKSSGRIVAFTVGLSRLDSNPSTARQDIHFLDSTYGGTTRVQLTVLRAVGPRSQRDWQAIASSPVIHVQPFLGQVVRFPLPTSLPVRAGDTVALTTPTWAPVLSIDLSTKQFAYRQSRSTSCDLPPSTSAAQSVGQSTQYRCNYTGTRVEYSATEITSGASTAATPVVSTVCPTTLTVTRCPAALARATALETVAAGVTNPTAVTASGRLVAFTLGLSRLSSSRATRLSDIRALNTAFGGAPEAAVTVLKPVGPSSQLRWVVAGESPLYSLSSYVGGAVQLVLRSTLPVSRGEMIALTTPTWVPVLWSSGSSARYAHRQSRATGCTGPPRSSAAQLSSGQSARYACNYPGVAASYSPTVIAAPVVPKNYVR